jgi:hypothetical protein
VLPAGGAEAESDRLELGYKFALTPEIHYGILRDDQSGQGLVILAEGDFDSAPYGTTNRIRGECTAGDDRSTLLVLYVDRRKVAQARATPKGRIGSRPSALPWGRARSALTSSSTTC